MRNSEHNRGDRLMPLKTAQIAVSKSVIRCATVSGFSPYAVVGIAADRMITTPSTLPPECNALISPSLEFH
jgi:hypothetical protein